MKVFLLRAVRLAPLLAAFFLGACATGRSTTTDRTAVEEALLSESAERALVKMSGDRLFYNRCFIEDSELKAPDKEYVLSALRLRMAKLGMHPVAKQEDADIIIYPRAGMAGIDDSGTLIGIPAIPLVVPGGGSVTTPELALFKRAKQIGRTKLGLYGIDAKSRFIAFDFDRQSGQAYYTRWTLLFIITFASTDLIDPYHTWPNSKKQTEAH
ncbi:hypothetical protein BH09SUM1_BH09SUM1_09280 [soil metagenome]